jgi:hypothetical protein
MSRNQMRQNILPVQTNEIKGRIYNICFLKKIDQNIFVEVQTNGAGFAITKPRFTTCWSCIATETKPQPLGKLQLSKINNTDIEVRIYTPSIPV